MKSPAITLFFRAGGIMTAAIDGLKCAIQVIEVDVKYEKNE